MDDSSRTSLICGPLIFLIKRSNPREQAAFFEQFIDERSILADSIGCSKHDPRYERGRAGQKKSRIQIFYIVTL
jgi:hypothetical protein